MIIFCRFCGQSDVENLSARCGIYYCYTCNAVLALEHVHIVHPEACPRCQRPLKAALTDKGVIQYCDSCWIYTGARLPLERIGAS